jgi:hypothetical protein
MGMLPVGLAVGYPVPIAAGKLISLKDAAGILFVVTGNDTFTLKSAATYNGSPTALPTITEYWTSTATDGSVALTANTQAAASTVVIASGMALFYVDAADLPALAEYVEVTVAASGLVQAYPVGLLVGRDPANLRVVSGSSS